MHVQSSLLVVAGSLSLTLTLGLAWCLAGVRYMAAGFLKNLFPNYQYLLKSHIDYLLMTGLLMVFFLLFEHFRVSPSPVILLAMCIGSLLNPFGFLVLAMKPNLRQHPRPLRSVRSWRAASCRRRSAMVVPCGTWSAPQSLALSESRTVAGTQCVGTRRCTSSSQFWTMTIRGRSAPVSDAALTIIRKRFPSVETSNAPGPATAPPPLKNGP